MPKPNSWPRILALTLAAVLIVGWAGAWWFLRVDVHEQTLFTTSGETLGTTYSVEIVQRGRMMSAADLSNIVEQSLERVNWLMSSTDPNSEVSRFNAATTADPVRISAETAEVIACAIKVNDQTAGAFDVTQALLRRAYEQAVEKNQPIDDAELNELRAHTGLDKLSLDTQALTLSKTDPTLTLDLRGLVPAYAADVIARALDSREIDGYKIEIGGQTRAKGLDSKGYAWTAVGQPLDGLAAATLHDTTPVRTLDARMGRPVTHDLDGVTVFHADALWAAAYANAILALGADDGLLMAKLLKLPAVLTVRGDGDASTERATPAYEEHFGPLAPK